MKVYLCIGFIVLQLVWKVGCNVCTDDVNDVIFMNNCYNFLTHRGDYSDCVNKCSLWYSDASLISVHSQEEYDWMVSRITSDIDDDNTWIGLTCSDCPDQKCPWSGLSWIDGSDVDFEFEMYMCNDTDNPRRFYHLKDRIPGVEDGVGNEGSSFHCFCKYWLSCFGKNASYVDVCSGHGNCYSNDKCDCDPNYFGEMCEVFMCHGYFNNDTANVCNGVGNCSVSDRCVCPGGYYGVNCSSRIVGLCEDEEDRIFEEYCYRNFGSGRNYSAAEAFCSTWVSINSHLVSIHSNLEETFVNETVLSNTTMWIGLHKNESSIVFQPCPPGPDKGFFWEDGSSVEYVNSTNVTLECDSDTSMCFALNSTMSKEIVTWSDEDCGDQSFDTSCKFRIPSCDNIPSYETSRSCNGHGICIGENNCSCFDNYEGIYCLCYCDGYPSDDFQKRYCSGHGECIAPELCSCDEFYIGKSCDQWRCFGINKTLSNEVCNNGSGVCIAHDICKCKEGFVGEKCSVHECFGVRSDVKGECSNHGDCESVDQCICEDDYYGPSCLEYIKDAKRVDETSSDRIYMSYRLGASSFYESEHGSEMIDTKSFNCSNIIRNWKELNLTYSTTYCFFKMTEYHGFRMSTELYVNIIDYSDPDYVNLRYKRISNLSMMIVPVTSNSNSTNEDDVTISMMFVPFTPNKQEPEGKGDGGNKGLPGYMIGVIIASVLGVFGIPATVILVLIVVCGCCCLFLVVLCCIIGFYIIECALACFAFVVTMCLRVRQYKKFGRIENIEFYLKQQREGRKSTKEMEDIEMKPKFEINDSLSRINYDELKLLDVVGEGGGGATVYRAEWNFQIIAFKCFKSQLIFSDQTLYEEFERESLFLGSVSHPNIIQLFGNVLEGPRIGFVMEYCPNDVDKHIRRNNSQKKWIGLVEKVRMLKEIASAMAYLHSRSVIHRDLKIDNVLLTEDMVCKVMDFGISRQVSKNENQYEQKTKRVGTGMYMAPEVVRGEDYDEKCDVYSFAILCWILIFQNFMPYGDQTFKGAEIKAGSNPYFRPHLSSVTVEFKPDFKIPNWLKYLIRSCWDHTPKNRRHFDEIVVMLKVKMENPFDVEVDYDEDDGKKHLVVSPSLRGKKRRESDIPISDSDSDAAVEDEGIYIMVKEKYEDSADETKRLLLLEPSYDHLCSLIYETFLEMNKKTFHYDVLEMGSKMTYRIRKLYVGDNEINSDEDVHLFVRENALVEIEFLDVEKSRMINELEITLGNIEKIKNENKELMRQLGQKTQEEEEEDVM